MAAERINDLSKLGEAYGIKETPKPAGTSQQSQPTPTKPVGQQPVAKKMPEFLNADSEYVTLAENMMKMLRKTDRSGYMSFGDLTTSKIRNILSLVNQIYNDVVLFEDNVLSSELENRIRYMKVRLVYEAGRDTSYDRNIKFFIEKAGLIDAIDFITKDKPKFIRFSRYLEALVAYHRFYGGKD